MICDSSRGACYSGRPPTVPSGEVMSKGDVRGLIGRSRVLATSLSSGVVGLIDMATASTPEPRPLGGPWS